MARPRVILADIDKEYLFPLETRFLQELQDEVDLEIITDPAYFRSLFSSPQGVDILVVCEEMYEPDLIRHDIKNLFVLSGREVPEDAGNAVYTRMYKYSSLKEIFGRIMAFSAGSLSVEMGRPKETMIIAVYSAAGGAGKTTISLGISVCMAQNFKKVLYVNADRINSFQQYFEDPSPLPMNIGMYYRPGTDVYNSFKRMIRTERFDYLPPFGAALSSLNVNYGFYHDFVKSAAEARDYDVIVVDADVTFDDEKVRLLALADRVIVVTTSGPSDIYATNLLMQNMDCSDTNRFYFVCNKYDPNARFQRDDRPPDYVIDENVDLFSEGDRVDLSILGKKIDVQRIAYLME